jgi:hypothetical protein
MTLPASGKTPPYAPGAKASYTAHVISEIDKAEISNEIRDLICCALCGRSTPWKDDGSLNLHLDWVLLRERNSSELFSVPLAGAEFYRRVAALIYRYNLIGIWCPDCAASRTFRSFAEVS